MAAVLSQISQVPVKRFKRRPMVPGNPQQKNTTKQAASLSTVAPRHNRDRRLGDLPALYQETYPLAFEEPRLNSGLRRAPKPELYVHGPQTGFKQNNTERP
jgi:hypothetical protein